jgi:hypothetical protein
MRKPSSRVHHVRRRQPAGRWQRASACLRQASELSHPLSHLLIDIVLLIELGRIARHLLWPAP